MFGSQKIPVYCHMGNFGCGDGGWTLAMKIDGTKVCSYPHFFFTNAVHILKMWKLTNFPCFYSRKRSITILLFGPTEMPITLQEGRLGSTHNRPSCLLTGTHPSPRSASVWRSVSRSSSSWLISRPTHCTHWYLTGNTVPRHWVITHGRRWLVLGRPCNPTATKKGSILPVAIREVKKQESVSLETTRGIV